MSLLTPEPDPDREAEREAELEELREWRKRVFDHAESSSFEQSITALNDNEQKSYHRTTRTDSEES